MEVARRQPQGLKDLAGVSGELGVFDSGLLRSLQWAAGHYVAPLAVVLAKATPPNLPRSRRSAPASLFPEPGDHPLAEVATAAAAGLKRPAVALVGRWQDLEWLSALAPPLATGGSVAIVTATGAEVAVITERAARVFGDRVVSVPVEGHQELTAAWVGAQRPGVLVVGPPRLAAWKVGGLRMAVVLEEGRRAMKDRQTPTIHVRDLMRTRSLTEGFDAVFFGPTPSVELLATGATIVRATPRAWGTVEIVDRGSEAPGSGLLSPKAVSALKSLGRTPGERGFVFTSPKMAEAVVEEGNRRLGRGALGHHPDGVLASVGSERDLVSLDPVRLAVAVNIDLLPGSSGYRAEEEALRQLARLANSLLPKGRLMAQTREPSSALAVTLRRADPMPFLEKVLADRIRASMPPAREMVAVEVRGDLPKGVDDEIRTLGRVEVYGPAALDDGRRWLISGDLSRIRPKLRELVAGWRERGGTVRVDADPIDL